MVINPILRGMNPDPSICSDGKYYYIVTSTFEYYPGFKIYRSTDLANWELIARPLTEDKINLRGIPNSAGIWAPGINYIDNKFYLTFSLMHQINGVYKDIRNYLITADDVTGEWSKPIYIGSQGFDPFIFKDTDGKFYIVSQNWDYRRTYTHQAFNGILIQEYDPKSKKALGNGKVIFKGTPQGGSEGPSIFMKDGYYYLLSANGGSGRHHAICVARSKNIFGPYELSPQVSLVTSYNYQDNYLQKAGHGNLVETPDGKTFLVHLVARYLPDTEISVLGRETAIEPIIWKDGWPYIAEDSNEPKETVDELPDNIVTGDYDTDFREGLDLSWSSLRGPVKYDLTNDGLKLYGNESLSSLWYQSLLSKSWPSFSFDVETSFEFDPKDFRDQAGLVLYYNSENWVFLYVSHDELTNRKIVNLQISKNGEVTEPSTGLYFYLPEDEEVKLRFSIDMATAQAYVYSQNEWKPFGRAIDASFLSDEKVKGWSFTGAMAGITVIDTRLKNNYATFKNFKLTNNMR